MKRSIIIIAGLFIAVMLLVSSAPQAATAQTEATTQSTATTKAPVYVNYTVKRGDTLAKIAQKYCTTWQEIYNLNRNVIGDDPNIVEPGTVLLVPDRCANCYYDSGPQLNANGPLYGNVYTVVQGDTLYSIATRFGMSSETLGAANGITDPTKLMVGQQLIISNMCGTTPPPTQPPSSNVAASRDFARGQCLLIPQNGAPGYAYPYGTQTTTFGTGGSFYAIQGVRYTSGQTWYSLQIDPGSGNPSVWVKDIDVAKSGDCSV